MTAAPSAAARLARSSTVAVAGSAINGVAAFGVAIAITRTATTTDDSGAIFVATAVFNVAFLIATLGAEIGLVRHIARDPSTARQLVRTAVLPTSIFSAALAGLIVVNRGWMAELLAGDSDPAAVETALLVVGPLVPVASLAAIALAASRGLSTMTPTVLLDRITRPVSQVVLVAGAGLVWGSVGPMALAWALAFVPSFIGGWRWWSRNSPAGLLDDGAPGDYWSFTAPQALTTVLNVLLRWVDIAVVAALTDTSTAALYTAASRLLLVGNFVNGAIMQAVSPMVADSLGRGDRRDAGELLGTGTAWLVALVWPLYVALIVMGAGFLELFGAEYRDAATALAILAVAMMVATGVGPIEAVLLMDGASRLSLADNAVAVVAMLAIDVALVPSMGLRGAAIGWAVGLLATNLLPLWQVWRRLSISPFGRAHAIAAIGAVAMMGAVTLATRSTLGDGLALAVVATAVGYGAHLALMTRFADELKLRDLRRALRKS